MAKNKNNNFKNSSSQRSKNSTSSSDQTQNGSMKDTNKKYPDNRPSRSGPGGE